MTAVTGDCRPGAALLVAWVAALAGLQWLLAVVGSGPLAAPPLADPSALGEWHTSRTPPEVLLSGVRLLALGLGWYLLGVTLLGAIVRMLRLRRLVAATDAVTIPAVRHLLRGALGIGLAAAVLTGGSGAHGGPLRVATAAAVDAHEPGSDAAVALEDPTALWGLPIDGPDRLPPQRSADVPDVDRAAAAGTGGPGGDGGAVDWSDTESHDEGIGSQRPATHTIQPGEHLWAVAARTLSARTGRAPTEADIAAYWSDVIEANRDRLPDPDDPDLIHPGDTVVLPAPPA